MSVRGSSTLVADIDDFGLAEHLAAIELMHSEALAQLDALVQAWAHLWSSRSEAPAAVATETAEFPVPGQPPVPEAQATAA